MVTTLGVVWLDIEGLLMSPVEKGVVALEPSGCVSFDGSVGKGVSSLEPSGNQVYES